MATSGSYDFAAGVTRNDIIDFALRKIGAKKRGMTTSAENVTDAAFALNLILQGLRENSDTSHSIKMWKRTRIRLFLEDGKDIYDTSDATDHIVAEDDLTTTAVKVAISATDTSIDIDATTGISASDVIGIVLDDGTMHWTTVASVTDTDTLVVDDQFPSAAAVDNAVYAYTANAQPPVEILTRMLRYEGGTESDVYKMDLEDYDGIYDKSVTGTPVGMYYERQRASGVFYLDVKANNDLEEIRMTVRYPIQDLDAAGDNLDVPAQWLRYIGWLLAIDIAPEHGIPIDPAWQGNVTMAYEAATKSDPETSDLFFEPDRIPETPSGVPETL